MKPIHITALVGALALTAGGVAALPGADDPAALRAGRLQDDQNQDAKKKESEKKADTVTLYILDAKGSG